VKKKVKKIIAAAVIAAAKNGAKNRKFFQNRYFSHKIFKNYVQGFFSHSKTTNDNLRKKLGF
jgi:hypothetical protein